MALVVGNALACIDTGRPAMLSLVEVTDSAGVQLVRNLDAAVDTQAVELVEELRIGTVFGAEEEQFHLVTGVAMDAWGRIFVVDQGTQAVRLFDGSGQFVRKFGGRGRGPGEFTVISKLLLWRDTVHVQNITGRFEGALFDTTGVLLATYAGRQTFGTLIVPLAGGPAGWLVSVDSLIGPGVRVRPGEVTRNARTIARIAGPDLARMTLSRAVADSLIRPFIVYRSGRTFWRAGPDGAVRGQSAFFEPEPALAIDGRGLLYLARGWPYVIDLYDSDGAIVRRVTRAHDSIPVGDALVAGVLRRGRSHYDTMGQRGSAMFDALEVSATLPRIGFVPVTGRLRASEDGWLWVQRPDLDPDPVTLEWSPGFRPRPFNWDVFDPAGHYQYTVKLPPHFTLYAVTANAVLGVLRDEQDVQYVVRYVVRLRIEGRG